MSRRGVLAFTRNGPALFLVLTVVIGALAAREIGGSRITAAGDAPFGAPRLRPLILEFPPGLHLTPRDMLVASDDASPGSAILWILRPVGKELALRRVAVSPEGIELVGRSWTHVRPRDGIRGSSFAVGRWDGRRALFQLRQARNGIEITVHGLTRAGVVARDLSPIARRSSNSASRTLAISVWSGRRPDLMVIDSSPDARYVWTSVYSGESHFRSRLFESRSTPAVFDEYSTLDVVRFDGGRPTLVGITRFTPTGSGRMDAHLLTGESRFREFALHLPLAFPQSTSGALAVGVLPARVVYLFDPSQPGRLELSMLPVT